jgi:hypothetical protein
MRRAFGFHSASGLIALLKALLLRHPLASRPSLARIDPLNLMENLLACLTHARRHVSVRSSSRAMLPMLLPAVHTRRTASALNSGVNFRRPRFGLDRLLGVMDSSFTSKRRDVGYPEHRGRLRRSADTHSSMR